MMPATKFDKLMSNIATLTPKQLAEAKARIALLASNSSSATDTSELSIVYDEVAQIIRRKTGCRVLPMRSTLSSRYGASFKEGAAELVDFARRYLQPKGRAGMIQAVRLLCGLVVQQIETERKVRLAIGPACSQLKRIGEIVEQNFPGYLAAGLLHIVLTRRPRPSDR